MEHNNIPAMDSKPPNSENLKQNYVVTNFQPKNLSNHSNLPFLAVIFFTIQNFLVVKSITAQNFLVVKSITAQN